MRRRELSIAREKSKTALGGSIRPSCMKTVIGKLAAVGSSSDATIVSSTAQKWGSIRSVYSPPIGRNTTTDWARFPVNGTPGGGSGGVRLRDQQTKAAKERTNDDRSPCRPSYGHHRGWRRHWGRSGPTVCCRGGPVDGHRH